VAGRLSFQNTLASRTGKIARHIRNLRLSLRGGGYRFHNRTLLVTSCGRICLHRKKINLSKSLACQADRKPRLPPSRRATSQD